MGRCASSTSSTRSEIGVIGYLALPDLLQVLLLPRCTSDCVLSTILQLLLAS